MQKIVLTLLVISFLNNKSETNTTYIHLNV